MFHIYKVLKIFSWKILEKIIFSNLMILSKKKKKKTINLLVSHFVDKKNITFKEILLLSLMVFEIIAYNT